MGNLRWLAGMAGLFVAWLVIAVPRAGAQETIDNFLTEQFDFNVTQIEIAPMVKKGDSTPGTWTTVPNGFFGGILARAGITPDASDPKRLKGRPGFLEYVGDSGVLNKGGTRATFGYFVKFHGQAPEGPVIQEFFILMSYDTIKLAGGKPQSAFEVFIFGPLPRPGSQAASFITSGVPPLIAGLAVNGSGELLAAVPLEIARVKNFASDEPETKPVTPGVNTEGKGCFECHGRDEQYPQSTLPFPWIARFPTAGGTSSVPAAGGPGTGSPGSATPGQPGAPPPGGSGAPPSTETGGGPPPSGGPSFGVPFLPGGAGIIFGPGGESGRERRGDDSQHR